MKNVKEQLDKLLSTYLTEKQGNNNIAKMCADELFKLAYYKPRVFGICMQDDELSDFLISLYPNLYKNIFEKYDKTKSSFFTFVCACLKHQSSFFLNKN